MAGFNLRNLDKAFPEFDWLNKVFDYNRTEENLKNCEPFEELTQKYIILQKRYVNSFHELNKDIDAKTYRREYSKGGECIHRGFYSPSAADLVAGNSSRGKLLKKPPKDNNYDYEYVFDDQNNIICVHKYSDELDGVFKVIETELFVYEQDKVLSFLFESNQNCGPMVISECKYEDGKLMRYEHALCELYYGGEGCTEINVETYEYADDLLKSFCWYRYSPSIQSLEQDKYTFARDEEGYLSTYTVEQIGGYRAEADCGNEPETYKVRVKRK